MLIYVYIYLVENVSLEAKTAVIPRRREYSIHFNEESIFLKSSLSRECHEH
jgi:hypothetical protein